MNEREIFGAMAILGALYVGLYLLNRATGSGRPLSKVTAKQPGGWMIEGAKGEVM